MYKNFFFVGKINDFAIEKIYMLMMFFFGIILVFITPPFQIPDEPNHFYRAYQISEGILRSPSIETSDINGQKIYYCADVPTSLNTLFTAGIAPHGIIEGQNYFSLHSALELFSIPLNSDSKEKKEIPNTGSYSPLVYTPQALGIFLVRLISDSVGLTFYAARIGALIFIIICGILSLRLLPEKSFLMFVISFSPMFLFEVASCSADPIVYAVTILAAAYFLSLCKENKLSTQDFIFFGTAAISLGLAKQVYGTILLLYFLIPSEKFGGKKNFLLTGFFIFALYLLAAVGWMHFSKSGVNVSPYMFPFPNVNLEGQIEFLKNNPMQFIDACLNTLQNNFTIWKKEFIGVLGWLSIDMPNWFYYFYSAMFLLAGCIGKINITITQRALLIFSIIPVFFAMMLYVYLTWTPVGDLNILGFQGRYLIPCALMFFTAFSCVENIYEKYFAYFVGFLSATLTVYKIIEHFY